MCTRSHVVSMSYVGFTHTCKLVIMKTKHVHVLHLHLHLHKHTHLSLLFISFDNFTVLLDFGHPMLQSIMCTSLSSITLLTRRGTLGRSVVSKWTHSLPSRCISSANDPISGLTCAVIRGSTRTSTMAKLLIYRHKVTLSLAFVA